eukprot:4817173-Amphidinium_carterae.1
MVLVMLCSFPKTRKAKFEDHIPKTHSLARHKTQSWLLACVAVASVFVGTKNCATAPNVPRDKKIKEQKSPKTPTK